jgi:hypothetical protein
MERHWFDDGRPVLQLLDLCDVQQNYSLILKSQDFFGLRTGIRCWLPDSLLEAGFGGFGVAKISR